MGSEPLLFLCPPSVHVSASSSRRPDVDADQWINRYPAVTQQRGLDKGPEKPFVSSSFYCKETATIYLLETTK